MGNLKTKKGVWLKEGKGASYRGYSYRRAAPRKYTKTAQQAKIGEAGRKVGAECKGKKGSDFRKCRHDILKGV